MSNDDLDRFIESDDDLPEPGPEYADTLFTDKFGKTFHCLPIEGLGWAWQRVE